MFKKGFTILETIISVTIFSVLMAIIFGAWSEFQKISIKNEGKQDTNINFVNIYRNIDKYVTSSTIRLFQCYAEKEGATNRQKDSVYDIKYSDIIKARIYGQISEQIKNDGKIIEQTKNVVSNDPKYNYTKDILNNANNNLFKNALYNNFKVIKDNGIAYDVAVSYFNGICTPKNTRDIYITEKIKDSSNTDFFIISKLSDHDLETTNYSPNSIEGKMSNILKHIKFTSNETDLTMNINCNLQAKKNEDELGFFNFAVFERGNQDIPAVLRWQQPGEYETYAKAKKRRPSIKLGNLDDSEYNNSIIADNINIIGSIKGKGHIASIGTNDNTLKEKHGNIIFEAVGSGVEAGEENWVSIWSDNDINIKTISADLSADAQSNIITESKFRGILYSKKDINISVENNVNFKVDGSIICGNNMSITNNGSGGIVNFTVTSDPTLSNIVLSRFVEGWKSQTDQQNETTTTSDNSTLPKGRFKAFNRI